MRARERQTSDQLDDLPGPSPSYFRAERYRPVRPAKFELVSSSPAGLTATSIHLSADEATVNLCDRLTRPADVGLDVYNQWNGRESTLLFGARLIMCEEDRLVLSPK